MTVRHRRHAIRSSVLVATVLALNVAPAPAEAGPGLSADFGRSQNIWVDRDDLMHLPTSGAAWNRLAADARGGWGAANISDQESDHDVLTFAGALYAVRTNDLGMRNRVIRAIEDAIGTERGGRTLALGRNLTGYVLAADLVGYESAAFRTWLSSVRFAELDGRTLVSTHEERPNNWGTHAGTARIAADRYLGDRRDLDRAIEVFRGFLGDRSAYRGFRFGDDDWQANPSAPVPINPRGATRNGHVVDGAIVDDLRRCDCPATSPAPREHYQWEGMQGIVAQATLIAAAGRPDVWSWSDFAVGRATEFLYVRANYPASDDDTFLPFLIDAGLGTGYSAGVTARSGKSLGYTDWTHRDRTAVPAFDPNLSFVPGAPSPWSRPPQRLRIPVTGVAGVPGSGVAAVSLNLTAVNTWAPGFARIWPCDSNEPSTSALNFRAGEVVANSMVVPVGASGEVCVATSTFADVIVDIDGWIASDADTTNRRLVDTRETGRSASRSPLRIDLDGVPSGATAVTLTLTAVNTTGPGFMKIWPCGSSEPTTSALNFFPGQVVANSMVVPVDATGQVCVSSSVGADVIVDTLGSFDGRVGPDARRLVDTRAGHGPVTGVLRVPLGRVPAGFDGVSVTLTAVNTSGPGFLTVWPCGADEPATSAVNYLPGEVRANSMILPVDGTAALCVRSRVPADVIVDTLGWVDWDVDRAGRRLIDTRAS